jgi:hypothetical protein
LRRLVVLVTFWLLALAASAHAQAARAPRISDAGRVLAGGTAYSYWASDAGRGDGDPWYEWEIQGSPEVSYFIVDRVALGLAIGGSRARRARELWNEDRLGLHLSALARFDVVLSERVSLLPSLAVGWEKHWNESDVKPTGRRVFDIDLGQYVSYESLGTEVAVESSLYRTTSLRTELHVPLVFHASPNLAFGLGPLLGLDKRLSGGPDASGWRVSPYRARPPRQSLVASVGLGSWIGVGW